MKDNFESTALMHASEDGHAKCVDILVKTKELGMRDEDGLTTLIYAEEDEKDECVKILRNAMKNQ